MLNGFKAFVTVLFLLIIGTVNLDAGWIPSPPSPKALRIISSTVIIVFFIISCWEVWTVNRLMSQKHSTQISTKIVFWALLLISVVGLFFQIALDGNV